MEKLRTDLSLSLQTGFIDQVIKSMPDYHPQFLVNDKDEKKKILSSILNGIDGCEEFWFSVAFMTTGGVSSLINTLEEFNRKGKKGKLLVSQYLNFTQPEALRRILLFKNIDLKISVDRKVHSKGYLFKNKKFYDLIIGSSNLTSHALSENIEWNLKVSATRESAIINSALKAFETEFEFARKVTKSYIDSYEEEYKRQRDSLSKIYIKNESVRPQIVPNTMQEEALININKLRAEGKRKYLLISATGTGKTYLSAFDARNLNVKSLLFIVHRKNIAERAMETFKDVFGKSKTMGMYSGEQNESNGDFVFSTIQTLSRENHLKKFKVDRFDYIIIDESHRAAADSYIKILKYFNSKYLLGMTATPERTDGHDIFQFYDHNIAYEIRLQKAMEMGMVCPFHYFGIIDISIGNKILEEKRDFSLLTSKERVNHVIEKAKFYGCDSGEIRGLVFCSGKDECFQLSHEFNQRGYRTIALDAKSSDEERSEAISCLESDLPEKKIDYIFTVDIFNEGVDIPRVNQIIMLRPTESAIIFVQQLGRGLRKTDGKDYLTVLDFIGNYSNNFLIPIALYGDTSFNKDTLRKLISSGSEQIPGSSTINFDEISKKQIFSAIDKSNLQLRKDLVNDYNLLKYKLGRIPSMVDFIEHSSRSPDSFVNYSKSYYNFILSVEGDFKNKLPEQHKLLLELFSNEIANAKRIVEVIMLKQLLFQEQISLSKIKKIVFESYKIEVEKSTIDSCIRNLNFEFIKKPQKIVVKVGDIIKREKQFDQLLKNEHFYNFLNDLLNYSEITYRNKFKLKNYRNGFLLYEKYSRKDACRILNWESNEDSTMYGYKIKYNTCPIFVNYHKEGHISRTTLYKDEFIDQSNFQWYSRSNRKITSNEISSLINHENKLKMPLFIKRNNDEGADFYFMGFVTPKNETFKETTIEGEKGKKVPIVKVVFSMNDLVKENIYNYITKL